jgi:hypothetical protein
LKGFLLKNASLKMQRTTRSRLPGYSFALLSLAVLVFAWGLQYKLSLYSDPHSVVRHMVQAKLVSNKDRATVLESIVSMDRADGDSTQGLAQTARPFGSLFVPLLALTLLLAAFPQTGTRLAAQNARRSPSRASFTAFFFRPPPSRN